MNEQLHEFLDENNLLPEVQSAYRKCHSTKRQRSQKVLSDVYAAADIGQVSFLALLDLSSAFDAVDFKILMTQASSFFWSP